MLCSLQSVVSAYLRNSRVPASPARPKLETSSTESRSAHPSSNGDCESGDTKHDEWVHARDLGTPCVDILVCDDRRRDTNSDSSSDDRSSQVNEAALASEVEEAVPGQDLGSRCGGRVLGRLACG